MIRHNHTAMFDTCETESLYEIHVQIHCSSLVSSMNEYLIIDSGGYLCMNLFSINCTVVECFLEII